MKDPLRGETVEEWEVRNLRFEIDVIKEAIDEQIEWLKTPANERINEIKTTELLKKEDLTLKEKLLICFRISTWS